MWPVERKANNSRVAPRKIEPPLDDYACIRDVRVAAALGWLTPNQVVALTGLTYAKYSVAIDSRHAALQRDKRRVFCKSARTRWIEMKKKK